MPLSIIPKRRYFLILHQDFFILSHMLLSTLFSVLNIIVNVLKVFVRVALVELIIVHVRLLVCSHHHTTGIVVSAGIFRWWIVTIYQLMHLINTLELTSQKRALIFIVCIHVIYHYWWFIMRLVSRLKGTYVDIIIAVCICTTNDSVKAINSTALVITSVLWWSKHRSCYTPRYRSHRFYFLISFLLSCIMLQFTYLFLITHFLVS